MNTSNRRGRPRKGTQPSKESKENIERTTLVLNKVLYAKIRKIAILEGVTIKDLIEEMFRMNIEKYEDKHGPIDVDAPKNIHKIFE